MAKKSKRDPNVPVLHFKVEGGSEYKVKIANPGDVVRCEYNPKHDWAPGKTGSLIVIEIGPAGIKEVEHDLFDPSTWGWIGRLMSDRDIKVNLLSKTDMELFRDNQA